MYLELSHNSRWGLSSVQPMRSEREIRVNELQSLRLHFPNIVTSLQMIVPRISVSGKSQRCLKNKNFTLLFPCSNVTVWLSPVQSEMESEPGTATTYPNRGPWRVAVDAINLGLLSAYRATRNWSGWCGHCRLPTFFSTRLNPTVNLDWQSFTLSPFAQLQPV